MKNIIVVCNMGMSSGSLMQKIKKHAESIDYECTVNAYPVNQLGLYSKDADVIMVGPQVVYQMGQIKTAAGDTPIVLIPPMTFATMDGKSVLELAIQEMEKQQ